MDALRPLYHIPVNPYSIPELTNISQPAIPDIRIYNQDFMVEKNVVHTLSVPPVCMHFFRQYPEKKKNILKRTVRPLHDFSVRKRLLSV